MHTSRCIRHWQQQQLLGERLLLLLVMMVVEIRGELG
jgi:hypothetical protein